MPKLVTANARTSVHSEHSEAVPIALIVIDHDELDEPLRISTDPTVRLSDDPLRYGTIHKGETFFYALVQVPMPEQGQDASGTVSIVIDIVTPEIAKAPTLVVSPGRVDIIMVMSSSPDDVEFEWLDLELKEATVNTQQGTVTLEVGRLPWLEEPAQRHRMTSNRFPGLHRR